MDRIQFRRDTAARWIEINPILMEGELGLVTDNPNQYKIGDGTNTWNDLPLRGYTGTISQGIGNDENAVMSQKTVSDLIGLSEYPTFSEGKDYAVGDVVNKDGKLYEFTAEHAAGTWLGTDIEETSVKKELDKEDTKLERFINAIKGGNLRFTYWRPTRGFNVSVNEEERTGIIKWDSLTIFDTLGKKVHSRYTYEGCEIQVPINGVHLVYAIVEEGQSDASVYYTQISGTESEQTSSYKKIDNNADILLPMGIVETTDDAQLHYFDILKLSSYNWGNVPSLTDDVNNTINSVNDILNSWNDLKVKYGYYTYWKPSTKPYVEISQDSPYINVVFSRITIANTNRLSIITNQYAQNVSVPKNSTSLVYYDLNDKKIYYSGSSDTTDDFKKVTNNIDIIPLGFVDSDNIYYDILAITSRYISDEFDLSVEGLIRKLYPENTTDPMLYIKYKWDISGSNENKSTLDVRLTKIIHQKYSCFYIKGRVSVPAENSYGLNFCIDDNGFSTGTDEKTNLFIYSLKSLVDSDGNFEAFIKVPDSIWNNANFETGCNTFVLLYNSDRVNVSLYIDKTYSYSYPNNDSYEFPLEDIADSLKYTSTAKTVVEVSEIDKEMGNVDNQSLLNLTFPYEQHVDYSATVTNSESNTGGYLTEITACVSKPGTFTFKVGLLDQYPRFVVSQEFDLLLQAGLNTINVSSLNIPIQVGEQVAISCTAKDTQSSIKFRHNDEVIQKELFYGENNGIWKKLNTDFGGQIILSYKTKEVNTIFADKKSLNQVKEQIYNQTDKINSLQYVYDENGVPYKLVVRGGELTLKNVQYKKVLALGNSLTSHNYSAGIGYYGDSTWAMASTNKTTTTWTNHLQNILRQKQPDATVTPFNIATWETDYMGCDLNNLFSSINSNDYDLIVIRAGENGTAGSDYSQGVDRLIMYLKEHWINADIVVTSMLWHNSTKEAGFKEISKKYNYPYVDLGDIADKCLLGQMLMGRDDVLHPITHNGVAGHCTDVCFFDLANILAASLGYSQITGKHSVTINTSLKYAINNNYQIRDGYVSILTYNENVPNISVKSSSGNVVEITNHSLADISWINTPSEVPTYVSTFKMPNSDVTVTIL